LGVHYILEGSVRRSDDDIRINVQLIDATTGGHLWAERYDRRYSDVFSLQDELIGHKVTALALKLKPVEEKRLARHQTNSIQAYDKFLQGWAHYELRTRVGFAKAVPFFQKAIELDPNYSRAHAALAAAYWLGAGMRAFNVSQYESRRLAKEHLQHAMENPTSIAHRVASLINTEQGQHAEAIADAERAIELDPNDPIGYFAMNRALTYAGSPVKAIDYIKKAMWLNPHYPPIYLYRLGLAQFSTERYNDAAASLEQSILRDPDFKQSLKVLVPTYGHLNRLTEAKATLERLHKLGVFPGCRSESNFKEKADRDRWCAGFRKAAGKG
jgi:adenylate cyclase